jgi:hypothetical protein
LGLPSIKLNGDIYIMDDISRYPQQLRNFYTDISGSIDSIQDGGAAIADCTPALHDKNINPSIV